MSKIKASELTREKWFSESELIDAKDSEERWHRRAEIELDSGEGWLSAEVYTTYLSCDPVIDGVVSTMRGIDNLTDFAQKALSVELERIAQWEREDRALPEPPLYPDGDPEDLSVEDVRPGDWAVHTSLELDDRPVFGVDYEQGLVWLGVRLDHMGRPTSIFGPMPAENYHFYRGNKL